MSVGHAENSHFEYNCTSKLKTKFLGNSLDVYPVGRTQVTLKRSGHVLQLVPPPTKVHNLIFGRTWVDSPGDMVLSNLSTGDKVVLYFQPCGWFGCVGPPPLPPSLSLPPGFRGLWGIFHSGLRVQGSEFLALRALLLGVKA